MIGLEMLDVAIGMSFIFLMLSLICTALNELIEGFIKLRAVDLEQGIRELLQDQDGKGSTVELYKHPLIFGLFRGGYDPDKIKNAKSTSAKAIDKSYEWNSELPSYIPARTFALALADLYNSGKLTDPNIQQAVATLTNAAGGDFNKSIENIETWYNSSMDRVSGWYKRRVQRIVFCLGFVIAIFINADTIAIFRSLTDNPALREAVVTAAQQNQANSVEELETRIDSNMRKLERLSLPIGWNWKSEINDDKDAITNMRAIPPFNKFTESGYLSSIWLWFVKVIGWFATGVAISLGSPFWFDVLNKFMVVRSTVKPTEKSPEESSEDRQKKA